jgi:molybdate transport system substrate-binding protein
MAKRRQARWLLLGAVLAAILASPARAQKLSVFAAASLTESMRDISQAWAKQGHPDLALSFASSSTLARQIEQGAPAQLFASADEQWMDYLDKRDLIAKDSRRDLLTNTLVLVVPANQARHITIDRGLDVAGLLGASGRLAVGDPAHVPAGIYAKQALTRLGLWPAVESRLAPAEDVRGALLLVERGEVPAGIVYGTDAAATKDVAIAGIFPANSHDAINYPFAIVKTGDNPASRALLAFLESAEAKAIFARRGFSTE